MLIKTIISIIFAPIIFIGQLFNTSPNDPVYVAPEKETSISEPVVETKATTTKNTEKETNLVPRPNLETNTNKTETKTEIKIEEKIEIPVKIEPEPLPDFEKINTEARKTTINILCTTKYNDLSPISGTGVLINSQGLILTNAHIAQYFLLKDFGEKDYLKCIGRTGSPAYPKYNLELVYISPNWVEENKAILKDKDPQGTGKDDFAFIRITETLNPTKNETIPYIQPSIRENIKIGEPVLLASYPAGFLGGLSILRDLNIVSSITNIQDVFTFKEETIDVISVGGTVVSQKGSSGGLVVDKNSLLIGIITTSSNGETTSTRNLNAITTPYINRSLQKEISLDLISFLNLNHEQFAKNFQNTKGAELSKMIIDELIK